MSKNFDRVKVVIDEYGTISYKDAIGAIIALLDEKDGRIDELEARIAAAEEETRLLKNKVHRIRSR
jgi:hypothetical protein